jgi:hypothetical protein
LSVVIEIQTVYIDRLINKHLLVVMWRRVNVSFAEDPIPRFPTQEEKEREKMKKKLKELKVLFVSRRDTCRGPIAECIFDHLNDKFAFKPFARFFWRSASAGMIRYNGGHLPDQLALRVLAENKLQTTHGSRQVSLNNLIKKLSIKFV